METQHIVFFVFFLFSLSQGQFMGGDFEEGTPNPFWEEASINFGTPLCTISRCSKPISYFTVYSGQWWALFGAGGGLEENSSLTQWVYFNETFQYLQFYVFTVYPDSGLQGLTDFFKIEIDNTEIWRVNASNAYNYFGSWVYVKIPLVPFQFVLDDGEAHSIRLSYHSPFNEDGNFIDINIDKISFYSIVTTGIYQGLIRTSNAWTSSPLSTKAPPITSGAGAFTTGYVTTRSPITSGVKFTTYHFVTTKPISTFAPYTTIFIRDSPPESNSTLDISEAQKILAYNNFQVFGIAVFIVLNTFFQRSF